VALGIFKPTFLLNLGLRGLGLEGGAKKGFTHFGWRFHGWGRIGGKKTLVFWDYWGSLGGPFFGGINPILGLKELRILGA